MSDENNCRFDGDDFRACKGMERLLDGTVVNEQRRGLTEIHLGSVVESRFWSGGVAYKNARNTPGSFLNYCPMCGAVIKPRLRPPATGSSSPSPNKSPKRVKPGKDTA